MKLDDSDNSPGWKYAEYEMKGVPVRIEIGPRDIEANQCVLVSRITREKTIVSLDNLNEEVAKKLEEVRVEMMERAKENKAKKTFNCTSIDEMNKMLEEHGDVFLHAMWCESEECEDKVKELTGAGSRCIPFAQEHISDTCVCCGKPATKMVLWGKAY